MKKKLKNLTKVFAFAFALLFAPKNSFAQGYACGTDYCVENNLDCPITVDIIFYCNNWPCNASSPVTIAPKTTYCMQWPCSNCPTANCDVAVTLNTINGTPIGAPNTVSGANPGPIYPPVPPGLLYCFDGGTQTPTMKWTGTLCWIGY